MARFGTHDVPGGGLIGYGQLVIIKHDEVFLSACGYNANCS